MGREHLAVMIREAAHRFGEKAAMRYRDGTGWKSVSYRELGARVQTLAKALLESGIRDGDRVGIVSQNRPEWAVADFAILSVRAVSVPVYATSTAKQAEYIAEEAGLRLVFVGDQAQYDKILSFRARLPTLEKVIAFDEDVKLSSDDSLLFRDLVALGSASIRDSELPGLLDAASGDEVATLIYTSGTTGEPKGAMLTHANFFHQFRALDARFEVGEKDRSLCFLPLSHVYERAWSYYVFRSGAQNTYLSDPKDVINCMPEVRPTAMVSVPRLYEKIWSTVIARVESGPPLKRRLFKWAMRVGREYQHRRFDGRPAGPLLSLQHGIADRLVLSRIRDIVGGEKNFFSAGGAPLAKEIEEFFFSAGLLICQGYGLTETSPMLTCNAPGAFKFGTAGRPILGVEIKFAENGEILARGGNVMKGYYRKPAETAAAFEEGWFKTGDVGEIDEDGFLRITDRIKDLIITSGGKNVAPQYVEGVIRSDYYIEQVVTIGDRRKFVSALVVPSFLALEQHANDDGIPFSSREDLVRRPEILAFYERRIRDLSRDLAAYEQVKRFTLMPGEFTQEAGELTPTLKVRRRVVEEKYRAVIDAMYEGDEGGQAILGFAGPGQNTDNRTGKR